MSKGWTYSSGDWNLICDDCSKKIKASESKQRWDGFIVCPACYENRHPQDFIRVKGDKISVPFSRPQQAEETFVDVPYVVPLSCTLMDTVAEAGVGAAGCAKAGYKLLNGL